MNETIPERCPKLINLKDWKNRKKFMDIEPGNEWGYTICEINPCRTSRRDSPSVWMDLDGGYDLCHQGKYIKLNKNEEIKDDCVCI